MLEKEAFNTSVCEKQLRFWTPQWDKKLEVTEKSTEKHAHRLTHSEKIPWVPEKWEWFKGIRVIQGKTDLCGIRARTREIVTILHVYSPPLVHPPDRCYLSCVEPFPHTHGKIWICIDLVNSAYFTLVTVWDLTLPNPYNSRGIIFEQLAPLALHSLFSNFWRSTGLRWLQLDSMCPS